MTRLRALVALAALIVTAGLVAVIPATAASAAACSASWQASAVYWGDAQVSHNGRNYRAKWWTQNEAPPGTTGVWEDLGACGGGSTPPPTNPGGFVVTEAQFNQMFPGRNSFYTYSGLVAALSAYPAFARTGSATVQRQEAAAFLANVYHETGGLVHVVEQNTANYPHYCDYGQPYGCPAGQAAYYGRGPIQLSWNFNYNAAGNALNLPLLTNPWLVQTDASVAWKTGIWYWMTQNGPGTMTAHNAMVNGAGFGQTIRSINGSIECNGGNPAQVQSRVTRYQQFVGILGVSAGANLYC
ncbi:glycoside hydrolase family 19 protein [Micromonospora saelicesensis]|uniref:Predicted chitinase n=1 Tax=Micromonospora saelicesensis TaxID=285676 RepID=A0A1C4ZV82_9ACTN|nr:glycoside hydrolase family 19 protein [Micromonospora saelicesensis]SCF36882.1 Predicted chitinase [Micromonospora saelicesensis]